MNTAANCTVYLKDEPNHNIYIQISIFLFFRSSRCTAGFYLMCHL